MSCNLASRNTSRIDRLHELPRLGTNKFAVFETEADTHLVGVSPTSEATGPRGAPAGFNPVVPLSICQFSPTHGAVGPEGAQQDLKCSTAVTIHEPHQQPPGTTTTTLCGCPIWLVVLSNSFYAVLLQIHICCNLRNYFE